MPGSAAPKPLKRWYFNWQKYRGWGESHPASAGPSDTGSSRSKLERPTVLPTGLWFGTGLVQSQLFEIGPEGLAQIRALERVLDTGLQESELVAAVMALSFKLEAEYRPLESQRT